MEHRNRHLMQHKMYLSTLVKMAITTKKSREVHPNKVKDSGLMAALASEAIESLKNNDTTCVINSKNRIIRKEEYRIEIL